MGVPPGRDGADEDRLRHALGAVAADVADDLPTARGMADVDGLLEVECLGELRQVVGVGVHVIPIPGLARTAVAAAVMRDAAEAVGGQEVHLVLEGIRREWPPMAEDDGLPCAPVLEVNLRAVLGDEAVHDVLSLSAAGRGGRSFGRHPGQTCRGGKAGTSDEHVSA